MFKNLILVALIVSLLASTACSPSEGSESVLAVDTNGNNVNSPLVSSAVEAQSEIPRLSVEEFQTLMSESKKSDFDIESLIGKTVIITGKVIDTFTRPDAIGGFFAMDGAENSQANYVWVWADRSFSDKNSDKIIRGLKEGDLVTIQGEFAATGNGLFAIDEGMFKTNCTIKLEKFISP